MLRTLLLCVLVVGATVALAVGSYSALAGAGPVTSVASVVVGADEPDDGDVVEGADDVDGDDVDGDEDGDDIDGDDVDAEEDGEGEPEMVGAEVIAEAIEGTFDAEPGSVMALHEQGIGFGALFKVYALAAAGETTVEAVLSAAEADGGFAFGKRFKEMADEVAELSAGEDGLPKNLGQAVSDGKKSDKAAALGAHPSKGHGPPDHAPAHGRR